MSLQVMHTMVRKELWGYAPDENLSAEDLIKVPECNKCSVQFQKSSRDQVGC